MNGMQYKCPSCNKWMDKAYDVFRDHDCQTTPPNAKSMEEKVERICYRAADLADEVSDEPKTVILADVRRMMTEALRAVRLEAIEEVATVIDTWHYKKGGYSELAHRVRSLKGGA